MARIPRTILAILLFIFLGIARNTVFAAMSSGSYQIQWDAIGVGVSDTQSSSSYKLRSSFESVASGRSTGTSYKADMGYRAGVYDRVVDFSVLAQSAATQVAATSLASTTVTLTSTSSYSVGDYIFVVQDATSTHIGAVGKVISLTSSTVTVDAWTTNGSVPTVDGTGDYAYELSGQSLSLGQLSDAAVTSGVIAWEVFADVSQGYSVYVMEDHDLTTPSSDTISDVADGVVTAGNNEYGARSTDSSLASSTFDTMDTAITSTLQQVASRSDNSFATRDFLTLKVAVPSGHSSGSYSQTLSLIFVGDY